MAAAVAISGFALPSAKTTKAADIGPTVKVLGATLRTDGNKTGTQSLRVGIEVANASYASNCGIKIKIKGSDKEIDVSTSDEQYQNLYSKDVDADKIVYSVVVANIPVKHASKEIEFVGYVNKIETPTVIFAQTGTVSKSVSCVVQSMSESLDEDIILLDSGDYAGTLVYKFAELDMSKDEIKDLIGNKEGKFDNAKFDAKGGSTRTYVSEGEKAPYYTVTTNDQGKGLGYDLHPGGPISNSDEYIYSMGIKADNGTRLHLLNWDAGNNEGSGDDNGKIVTCNGDWQNLQVKVWNTTQGSHYISTLDGAEKVYNIKDFVVYKVLGASDIPDVGAPTTGWNKTHTKYKLELNDSTINLVKDMTKTLNDDGTCTFEAKADGAEFGISIPEELYKNNDFRQIDIKFSGAEGIEGIGYTRHYGTNHVPNISGEDTAWGQQISGLTTGSGVMTIKANDSKITYGNYMGAVRFFSVKAGTKITFESVTLTDCREIVGPVQAKNAPAGNIITNGNFDDGTNGWKTNYNDGGLSVEDIAGNKVLKVSGRWNQHANAKQTITGDFKQGDIVTLSCDVYSMDSKQNVKADVCRFLIGYDDNDSSTSSAEDEKNIADIKKNITVSKWNEDLNVTFVVPENITSIDIQIRVQNSNEWADVKSDYYLDNVYAELMEEVPVDLTNSDAYTLEGAKATPNGTSLDVEVPAFQGIIIKAPDNEVYQSVAISYTSGASLNCYVFDADMTDGTGQSAAGQQEVAQLAVTNEVKTVTYDVQDNYAGNCIKGIKIVNIDWGNVTKNIHINSVKFIKAKPTTHPDPDIADIDIDKLDIISLNDAVYSDSTGESFGSFADVSNISIDSQNKRLLFNLPGGNSGKGNYFIANDEFVVYVKGTYSGTKGFSVSSTSGFITKSEGEMLIFPADHASGEFEYTFKGTATDSCGGLAILPAEGQTGIDGLSITEIRVGNLTAPTQAIEDENGIIMNLPRNYNASQSGKNYGTFVNDKYYSTYTKTERPFNVILPYGYSENKKYPVIYMLHGICGDQNAFGSSAETCSIVKTSGNLYSDGDAKEAIIVIPSIRVCADSSIEDSFSADNYKLYDLFREDLIDCLMPYMEANYSIATGRENTAIAGFSMGGRESLYIGISKPECFGYIGAFCPTYGIFKYEPNWTGVGEDGLFADTALFTLPAQYMNNTYAMIVKGTKDTTVHEMPTIYHNALTSNGVPHVYYEVEGGGHDEATWGHGMYNFLRKVFK